MMGLRWIYRRKEAVKSRDTSKKRRQERKQKKTLVKSSEARLEPTIDSIWTKY